MPTSPKGGRCPFHLDPYVTWLPNIHASLFYNTYAFLKTEAACSHLDALTKGCPSYVDHCLHGGVEVVLDLTRAWTLVRFFDVGMLQLTQCYRCTGKFAAHMRDLQETWCAMPVGPIARGKDQEGGCHAASVQRWRESPKRRAVANRGAR